jgi:N-acetylmuramoyl-L-alanine amidase
VRSFGLLVGALFGVLLAFASEAALAGAAVRGVRMSEASDHTRFVFDLSGPARHQLSHAAGPDRLIVDLGDSRLQGSLQTLDLARAPVSRIRSGMYNPTDLRVVLDLSEPVEAKSLWWTCIPSL